MTEAAVFAEHSPARNHPDAQRDIPFAITDPEMIPVNRYYDDMFFEMEREHFWPHVWQMACRLEEIPNVGDYVEYKILDKSVIVTRTAQGVRAYLNACRHRGLKLIEGAGNCKAQGFICPFHGWRWDGEGKNTFVYSRHLFRDKILNQEDINLLECRLETWGGCAFINFNADAPPLRECLKPVADKLDPRGVDDLKVEWWSSTILPVNWKLAMEAFMEGYHVMRTHPQLHQLSVPGTVRYTVDGMGPARPSSSAELIELMLRNMEKLSEGMAGMVHANDTKIGRDIQKSIDLPEDPAQALMQFFGTWNAEVTRRGRERGVPMPDLNDLAMNNPTAPVQFIFPHYFLLPMFGNMSAYRIRPLGPESCLFEIWSLVLYPEGEQRAVPAEPTPLPHDSSEFPEIPRQDYSNLPRQQLGLRSGGIQNMRLSHEVEGMISNFHRTLDAFLTGIPSQKLIPAVQATSGEYDDPIKDLGF